LIRKSMAKQNRKDRIETVFSTDPDFEYPSTENREPDTLPANQQDLRVLLDRKRRAGKIVTIVTGFVGTSEDLKGLGKHLKTACGVGGTVKDGEILIQGDFRERVIDLLKSEGYHVKASGG